MTLDARLTELIALGAATAANCAACLDHHVAKAREIGLSPAEIDAALDVGRRVRKGAAGALDRVAAGLGVSASLTGSVPATGGARACCG